MISRGINITNLSTAEVFPNPANNARTFCVAYLQLREEIKAHFLSGNQPLLAVCVKPEGAYKWKPSEEAVRY